MTGAPRVNLQKMEFGPEKNSNDTEYDRQLACCPTDKNPIKIGVMQQDCIDYGSNFRLLENGIWVRKKFKKIQSRDAQIVNFAGYR